MTTFLLFSVLTLCLLAGCRAQGGIVKPCNDSRSTSFSFSITSKRNQTGHWIAEVKLGPELTDNKHNGGWQFHVTKNTVDNSGLEPIVSIVAILTAPVPIASPGYELFPKIGYYKLHTEGKIWEEAKAACEMEGAHLAVIHCETEADLIKQLLARYPNLGGPNMAAHVGFNDQITEGQYVTIFGESLASTGFTRWSTIGSQPDDASPGEDCGSVHRNGGLNDFACDVKAPFLCKQDLFPASNVDSQKTILIGDGGETTVVKGGTIDVGASDGADVKEVGVVNMDGGGDKKDAVASSGGEVKEVGVETVEGGGDKKDVATGGGEKDKSAPGGETVKVDTKNEDGKEGSKIQGEKEKKEETTPDPDRIVFEEPVE